MALVHIPFSDTSTQERVSNGKLARYRRAARRIIPVQVGSNGAIDVRQLETFREWEDLREEALVEGERGIR